nr:hypothetical protein [uncultured Pedobacter sp.]
METQTNSPQVDANLDVCETYPQDLINAGKPITEAKARQGITDYLATTTGPNDPKNIFGFEYGLNTLRTFMEEIDAYNKNAGEKIVAVRIYHAITIRDNDTTKTPKRDEILVPVLESGNDLYKVAPIVGPPIIVGDTRPCPNQCKFTLLTE